MKVEGKAPAKPEGKEADKGDKANKGRNSEGSKNLWYLMSLLLKFKTCYHFLMIDNQHM